MQPTLKPELLAIITTMAEHLAKQRARAYDDGCKYRATNGTMCAVGCLIPDALYDRSVEGGITLVFKYQTVSSEREAVVNHLHSLAPVELDGKSLAMFLDRAQCFHDEDPGCDNTSYEGLLASTPAGTSDADLAARIQAQLVYRTTTNALPEWLA